MATTIGTGRKTAANDATLRSIKARMNGPIYRLCLAAMNEGGPDAVRSCLARFLTAEGVGRVMSEDR